MDRRTAIGLLVACGGFALMLISKVTGIDGDVVATGETIVTLDLGLIGLHGFIKPQNPA